MKNRRLLRIIVAACIVALLGLLFVGALGGAHDCRDEHHEDGVPCVWCALIATSHAVLTIGVVLFLLYIGYACAHVRTAERRRRLPSALWRVRFNC